MAKATDAFQPGGARFGALGPAPAVPPRPSRRRLDAPGHPARGAGHAGKPETFWTGPIPSSPVPGLRTSTAASSRTRLDTRVSLRAERHSHRSSAPATPATRSTKGRCPPTRATVGEGLWGASLGGCSKEGAGADRWGRQSGPRLARNRKVPWQWPTLPGRRRPSTIGASGLNDRVRNGTGCTPAALITKGRFHNVRYSVGQPDSASQAVSSQRSALADRCWKNAQFSASQVSPRPLVRLGSAIAGLTPGAYQAGGLPAALPP